ncbi:MAG: sulfatase [Polyangiaceae bacterium]|nr:sulfatase [Polyangiaceae bacterium]
MKLPRLTLTEALLAAVVPMTVFDAIALLARFGTSHLGHRLVHAAYVGGHRAALALALVGCVALFRLAPRLPRWTAPLLAFAAALAAGVPALSEDLEAFALPARLGMTAVIALAPAGLCAAAVFGGARRLVRLGTLTVALGAALANHTLLRLNYPGFHLACVVLSQLGLGIAMASAPASREPLLKSKAAARDAAFALFAAWSLAIPPSNRVAVLLGTDDASPVYRFAADFYADDDLDALGSDNPYFRPREGAPNVPAGAALVSRKDLIVLLVTYDAFRQDVAASHSFPGLDRLRGEGVTFTSAYSPATSTCASLSALFSGRHYNQLRWKETEVNGKETFVPESGNDGQFPELLSAAGVKTHLVASYWCATAKGGIVKGFQDEYKPNLRAYRMAAEALPVMGKWAKKTKRGPAFAYTHLMDAHAPYDQAGKEGTAFERYVRELRQADRQLQQLIEELEAAGVWDRVVMIVSADHGESFGEHGQNQHHGHMFEQQVHVPLVIRVPGMKARTIDEPVTLVDLGPTILDLFGLPTPGHFMGQSLVPLLRGEEKVFFRPVAMHSTKSQLGMVFPDRIKALYSVKKKRSEVYDLASDPGEEDNLADEPWAKDRIKILRSFFKTHGYSAPGYKMPTR